MFTNPKNCAAVNDTHGSGFPSTIPIPQHEWNSWVAKIQVEIFILTSATAADDASIPTPIEGESQG